LPFGWRVVYVNLFPDFDKNSLCTLAIFTFTFSPIKANGFCILVLQMTLPEECWNIYLPEVRDFLLNTSPLPPAILHARVVINDRFNIGTLRERDSSPLLRKILHAWGFGMTRGSWFMGKRGRAEKYMIVTAYYSAARPRFPPINVRLSFRTMLQRQREGVVRNLLIVRN